MNKRSNNEPNRDLERLLTELYHDPRPDPAFVDELQNWLMRPQAPAHWPFVERVRRLFDRLFATAPTLAWGAAAAVLVLALAWTLSYLIPSPVISVQPSVTPTAPATIAQPTPTPTPKPQRTPAAGPAVSTATGGPAGPAPTRTPAAPPAGRYPGWLDYSNPDYGFAFSYPPDWKVEAVSHAIRLKQGPFNTLTLTIGFRRSSEDVGIQHVNMVTGSRTEAGVVSFLDQEVSRQVVTVEEREKAVLYNGGAEIRLRDGLIFTLSLIETRADTAGATISVESQTTIDRVVGTFRRLSEEQGGGPSTYLGRLAYVWGGDLWVMELPGGAAQRLTTGGGIRQPRWAPSGERVAFRTGDQQVWVAVASDGADGAGEQALNEGKRVGAFAWSPARDWLAYIAGTGELRLADAEGKDLRVLVQAAGSRTIQRIAWSPAGDWIAFETFQRKPGQATPHAALWKVAADGGRPVELYAGNPTLAGWTGDGRALLFWDGGEIFSASLPADGARLMQLPARGGTPVQLAKVVLVYDDYVQPDPSGSARVAVVVGGPREAWTNKQLILFQDGSQALLSSSTIAAISPAWSFDGRQIAYVQAPDAGSTSGKDPGDLLGKRRLWLRDLTRNNARALTDDPAYRDEYPLWSADGGFLLFVRVDADGFPSLWLISADAGEPWQVVAQMDAGDGGLVGYYGYMNWGELLDWWRR